MAHARSSTTLGSAAATDVFISYAREDLEFVEGVVRTLGEGGLAAWVDISGLYAGEPFWPEITAAIDSAAAVIFVISQHSVTSAFCLRELNWAIDRGKRIVPVLRGEPDPSQIPGALASLQWVLWRVQDDPLAAADALHKAARSDWAWLREHARLLRKAEEWRASNRDRARTLRGRELEGARRFLSAPAPADARPVALHTEYVSASLRARKSRILKGTGAAATAAVAIVATGWLAVRSQIGSLNNLGYGDISRGSSATALAPLERAEQLCARIPMPDDRCDDVAANLSTALLDQGRYDDALRPLAQLVDGRDARPADLVGRRRRASAFLSRAYAHTMLAERAPDKSAREAAYGQAQVDLDAATAQFEQMPGDSGARRLDITRARIALGRGRYTDAVAALRAVAPFSREPDVDMLFFIAHRCLGDGPAAMASLNAYMDKLEGQTTDPHWLSNQDYIERLALRCQEAP